MARKNLVSADGWVVSFCYGWVREDYRTPPGHRVLSVGRFDGPRGEGDGREFSSVEEAEQFCLDQGYLKISNVKRG